MGPSHFPANLAWLSLFAGHLGEDKREGLFAHTAESDVAPHRIVHDLAVTEPLLLTLKGFVVSAAGDRCRAVPRRLKQVIEPRLEAWAKRSKYSPTIDSVASRLVYAEAIELARGKPTAVAQFVRWISGGTVTPRAAHKMRGKIASDLKLTGRPWQKASVPQCPDGNGNL